MRAIRLILIGGLVPALAALVFSRLIAAPSSLIADADRPGVDRAVAPRDRSVGNDLTRLFLPHHQRIASALGRTGRVPGWDPSGFGGRPLVGNPQAGLWYPPVWLAWIFWSPSALGWLTVGHLLWGALGVNTLARSVKLGGFASVIASASWIASPYVLSQTYEGHYPHVWAATWYPWAFWSAIGAWHVRRRGWLLPPILALAMLTGHAQEGFYLAVALAACGVVASCRPALRFGRAIRFLAVTAATSVVLASLMAVEVVPDLATFQYALSGRFVPRDSGKYHAYLVNLTQVLSPRALGGPGDYEGPANAWETMLGPGWVVAFLAVVAIVRSPRRRSVVGWAAIVVASTLFALGGKFGVFPVIFAVVPGMDRFRVPARSLFLASLGMSMLAGFGVEAVAASRGDWRRWSRSYFGLIAALIAILAASRWAAPGPSDPSERAVWLRAGARIAADSIFVVAALSTSLAVIWLRARPLDRRRVGLALGLMAAIELGLYGRDLIRVCPASRFLGPDPVGRAIARHLPAPGPFRVRARDAFYGDARAFHLGLEKTNLNDSFQIAHAADLYERLYAMFGNPGPPRLLLRDRPAVRSAVLDRMNVGLLVSDDDDSRLGWPAVERGEWDGVPFTLRANPDVLPRAYVVARAEVMPDGPDMVDRFPSVSPREAVFLDRDPLPTVSSRQPFTPAAYESSDPDRVEIRATTIAPGLLVVADTWMPGWSAELDGTPTAILKGNRAQRIVVLDRAGDHRVVMTYTAPGLAMGKAISLAALVGWGLALALASTTGSPRSGIRRGRTEAGNR